MTRIDSKPSQSPKTGWYKVVAIFCLILGLGLGLAGGIWYEANRQLVKNSYYSEAELADIFHNEDLDQDLDYAPIEEIYDKIRLQYDGQLQQQELIEGLKQGLVQALDDPHSEYIPIDAVDDYLDGFRGEFVGVGIYIELLDQEVVVVRPIKDSPADKAGILAGDIIFEVDGQNVAGFGLSKVANLIRGQEGTEVNLKLHRSSSEAKTQDLDLTITRAKVRVVPVSHEVRSGIGILTITKFINAQDEAYDTVALTKRAVDQFKQDNVKAVILDLRSNPGGELDVTRKIASLWLESHQGVVEVRRGDKKLKVLDPISISNYDQSLKDKPLIVLMDQYSASAAELLAGALRDHKVATIIGQTSFGKNSIQIVLLPDEFDHDFQGILKLTIQHYYTPLGKSVADGLDPDIDIDNDTETVDDEILDKAFEVLGD